MTVVPAMSFAEYHALDRISAGRINAFIESPAIYHARHVLPPTDPNYLGDDDTPATRRGSAHHALILEGQEAYEKRFRVWRGGMTKKGAPTMSRNSSDYEKFQSDCAADGVTEISIGDHEAAQNMAAAIWGHEDARALLHESDGVNEATMLFDLLGQPCKARADRIIAAADVIVDLKSTMHMTLADVQRAAVSNGYHRISEWYRRGYLETHGRPLRDYLFVSARAARPWLVWAWRFDAEAEAVARIEVDYALREIIGRTQTGDWLPDECRGIKDLGIKPWQLTETAKAEMEQRA
jgi:hypothetical protein